MLLTQVLTSCLQLAASRFAISNSPALANMAFTSSIDTEVQALCNDALNNKACTTTLMLTLCFSHHATKSTDASKTSKVLVNFLW